MFVCGRFKDNNFTQDCSNECVYRHPGQPIGDNHLPAHYERSLEPTTSPSWLSTDLSQHAINFKQPTPHLWCGCVTSLGVTRPYMGQRGCTSILDGLYCRGWGFTCWKDANVQLNLDKINV